jgi:hypothetical protein
MRGLLEDCDCGRYNGCYNSCNNGKVCGLLYRYGFS